MTFTLPNGARIVEAEEKQLASLFNYRCSVHPDRWMIAIHHEPPRSKNPDYKTMPETWFPVCLTCHELVHNMSRLEAEVYLKNGRDKFYPKVKEILREQSR